MLTGRLPFEADTPWQWASKHMTETPPPPSTMTSAPIPERVERAVLHALQKNRDDRPRHALDFYRELSGEAPKVVRTEPDAGPRTEPGGGPAYRQRTESAPVVPAYSTEAAVAAPIPPPPVRRSRLGVVLAVGGISLGVGLAAAAVWLNPTGSASSGSEPGQPPAPTESSTATEIAPLVDGAVTPELPPPEEPTAIKPTPTKTAPPAKTSPPITPAAGGHLPAASPHRNATTATPAADPASPHGNAATATSASHGQAAGAEASGRSSGPTGDAACTQSQSAARSGNIEGAVSLYNKCASTGGSSGALNTARGRIQAAAPGVVKSRAYLGNCAGARSAANAASSIGAGGPAQAALASTSCK